MPVTTGEIWNVWLEHPELVSSVDFIAAHILPYWEGFSPSQAVDQAIIIYDKLRHAYPGKRIVIAEFGWPSAGYNLKAAVPGRIEQAELLRDFVTRADAYGIDYNIVEAIDQPWKIFEGGVGPYWGIYDAIAPAEVQLDRPDRQSRPLEACRHRAAGERAAVAADPVGQRRHRLADRPARRRRQCGRRLVGRVVRLLERPLLRAGLGLRARPGHAAADPADRDRAGAHRGNRRHRLRPQAVAADPARRRRWRPTCRRAESLDPYSGLSRTAGDAQADARRRRAARLSEFRMRRRRQQHARPGDVDADRGALPAARRALQIRAGQQSRRLQGRRACGWRSCTPPPTPRSSASSTPTMS